VSRVTIRISQGEAPADARAIRRRVFVEEQGVAGDEERDEHDAAGAATLHFVAFEGERAVGCARLRAHGDGAVAKVERVAVLPEQRRLGLGRALMEAAERAARRRGHRRLVLHAQVAVVPFYERLGWRARGPEFSEAGMEHRRMEKEGPPARHPPL
jgi:predicted GNAT family N-acyltransferase